jgi:hypothetical protein
LFVQMIDWKKNLEELISPFLTTLDTVWYEHNHCNHNRSIFVGGANNRLNRVKKNTWKNLSRPFLPPWILCDMNTTTVIFPLLDI